jgi:hypothetical protein
MARTADPGTTLTDRKPLYAVRASSRSRSCASGPRGWPRCMAS